MRFQTQWMQRCLQIAIISMGVVLTAASSPNPMTILADSLQIDRQQNISIFSGNVQASQDDLVVLADTMTIHHLSGTDISGEEIDKIVLDGHVNITHGKRHAKGDNGFYLVTKKLITLDHHVVLTEDGHTVIGEHLVYDLQADKASLTGDKAATPKAEKTTSTPKGRVKAILVPEQK